MIVLHSLKVLEKLSEIEKKIAVVEKEMKERGIELDTDALLMLLIHKNQEQKKRA
jgi:hypothetical protein